MCEQAESIVGLGERKEEVTLLNSQWYNPHAVISVFNNAEYIAENTGPFAVVRVVIST